jgi:hypothetical protein
MCAVRQTVDLASLPKTRSEAAAAGSPKYFTGLACHAGHIDWRNTKSGKCAECVRLHTTTRRHEDPDYRAATKEWAKKNYEKWTKDPEWRKKRTRQLEEARRRDERQMARKKEMLEKHRATEKAKQTRKRAGRRRWERIKSDPELMRVQKERLAQWTKDKANAKTSARRAARQRALPQWVDERDKQEILWLYTWARVMSRFTGIPHEVDHIVPLKHPLVCGLHVPANLQVITETANRLKHNHFEV